MYGHLGIAGALQGMHEHMACGLAINRRIATLVVAFVAVGCMARRTADPTIVTSFLPALHGVMAALTFLPNIGEGGQGGILLQTLQLIHLEAFGEWFVRVDEDIRFHLTEACHVLTVRLAAQSFLRVVWVLDGVIGPAMAVAGQGAKGPTDALDFACFRHHQAGPLDFHLVRMALTARVFVDPRAARGRVEIRRPRAAMGQHFVLRFLRIATMANDAAGRVTQARPRSMICCII